MAQLSWTYVGDTGQHYTVGVFHGPNTGHLVVHCNLRVVLIDFHVLESKAYPLFLDDELCELKIEKKNGQFTYAFEINRKVDTPRNRERKKVEKKHWRQTLLFFGALGIVAAIFTGFFIRFDARQKEKNREQLLEVHGQNTLGVIDGLSSEGHSTAIQFSFIAGNRAHQGTLDYPSGMPVILDTGMPLEKGDEFSVRYLISSPGISELLLGQPSEAQATRYWERALARHAELHPELTPQQAECFVRLAYELKGINGLAAIRFQDTGAEENATANQVAYQRLTRSLPFQQRARRECW
ncbi:MAG: hypothetical protein KDC66_19060 [Phaeodactylibacter sp.]|nr:hypothetical protein [Phaeodactylibacter sp.]MCB9275549.1 hypothetical protein [Lewinellaceae bacterium]